MVFIEKDGTKVHCAGKKCKDLSKDIQSYMEDIKIPLVVASSGDIAAFSKTLIWKNDGVAWDDWQKLIMDTWFTRFRMQIDSIASKDKGHAPSRATLNLISGKKIGAIMPVYVLGGFIDVDKLVFVPTKSKISKNGLAVNIQLTNQILIY